MLYSTLNDCRCCKAVLPSPVCLKGNSSEYWQGSIYGKPCISSESLYESLHSNPSTFSTPYINNFFQITVGEYLGDSMVIFIKLVG